jgi:putative acetyltransferase
VFFAVASRSELNQTSIMLIRDERLGDEAAIASVTRAAFAAIAQSSQTEAAIVAALRAADALTLSLVADDSGLIVGHIAFSPVQIDGKAGPWVGLGPVSVTPERQREGIGGLLIREGLDRLAESGTELCVLLGHPDYYPRFGFAHDPALTYEGHVTHAFQRLILSGTPPVGRVSYHPGFAAT